MDRLVETFWIEGLALFVFGQKVCNQFDPRSFFVIYTNAFSSVAGFQVVTQAWLSAMFGFFLANLMKTALIDAD